MKYQVPSNLYVVIGGVIATSLFIVAAYKLVKSYNYNKVDPNKESFPELQGKSAEYALKYLNENYPHLKCYPIEHGSVRIQDLNSERVWLDYDENNNITLVPRIG